MNLHPGATWSAFAPTRRLVQHVGLFDENFYPAYIEEVDFAQRVFLLGRNAAMFLGALVSHGPAMNGEEAYVPGTRHIIEETKLKYANTKKINASAHLSTLVDRGSPASITFD